jgi:putative addiction module component (TIGR02574 family)
VHFSLDYTSLAGCLLKVEATIMSMSFEELVEHAMALPSESRALLADRLVESLDAAEMNRFDRLWAAEAQRRLDDVRSGRVVPIPGEQVLAEMRKRFGG